MILFVQQLELVNGTCCEFIIHYVWGPVEKHGKSTYLGQQNLNEATESGVEEY